MVNIQAICDIDCNNSTYKYTFGPQNRYQYIVPIYSPAKSIPISATVQVMNGRGRTVHLLNEDSHQWEETIITFQDEAIFVVLNCTLSGILLRYPDIAEINLGKATRALLADEQASRSSSQFFFSITKSDGTMFHFGTMDGAERQQIVFDLMDSIGSYTVESLSGIKKRIKRLESEEKCKIYSVHPRYLLVFPSCISSTLDSEASNPLQMASSSSDKADEPETSQTSLLRSSNPQEMKYQNNQKNEVQIPSRKIYWPASMEQNQVISMTDKREVMQHPSFRPYNPQPMVCHNDQQNDWQSPSHKNRPAVPIFENFDRNVTLSGMFQLNC